MRQNHFFFPFFILLNCWSSVVASVVLPQFVQISTVFFLVQLTSGVREICLFFSSGKWCPILSHTLPNTLPHRDVNWPIVALLKDV